MVKFCCFGSEPDPVHIHGHLLSPPSRSLLAFVELVGVPHEFHVIDLNTKAHLTEAYAKINPFQEVPALTHGNFNAWESGAMVTYIADSFNVNSPWYPKDIRIRARINSYLHWHHTNTRATIVGYLGPKFFGPKFQGAPELSAHDEIPLKKKLDGFFEDLIWLIRETGYVARTRQPTIADVFAYSEIASLWFIGFDMAQYPEVKVWFDKIGANKPVAHVHETLRNMANGMGRR
jgi:glutathione S-transferase